MAQLRRFARARLDRKSELGLRLTINVILFAAAIWAFAGLLEEVLDNATLVEWDIRLNAWAHTHATAAGLQFFHDVTLVGSPGVWVITSLFALWLLWRREHFLFWAWIASNVGGGICNWRSRDDPSRSPAVRGGVPARAVVQLSERPHDERDDLLVAHGRVRGALARLARQKTHATSTWSRRRSSA